MDVPGESSAFDAAARLGIPDDIIIRAKQLLGEDSKDLSRAVKNLEKTRQHFEERLQTLDEEKRDLKNREKDLERLKSLAEKRLRELSREEAAEMLKSYKTLRDDLAAKIAGMTEEGKQSTEIFEDIAKKSEELKQGLGQEEFEITSKRGLKPEELKKNLVVEIAGLGLGVVVEDFHGGGQGRPQVTVKVGEIKTRVGLERIFEASSVAKTRFEQSRKSWLNVENKKITEQNKSSAKGGSIICDVRGRTWEDAHHKIDIALNQLTAGDGASLTIIHGHGKEVLKEHIRSYLEKERSEFKFRTGSWPGEGGDGVTIVEANH